MTLVLFRMRRRDERLRRKKDGGVAFEKAVRRKPLAFAADAGLKPLPEAGYRKKVVIDAHRFKYYAWGRGRLILTRYLPFFKAQESIVCLKSPMLLALETR
jgi:hypothetical protein